MLYHLSDHRFCSGRRPECWAIFSLIDFVLSYSCVACWTIYCFTRKAHARTSHPRPGVSHTPTSNTSAFGLFMRGAALVSPFSRAQAAVGRTCRGGPVCTHKIHILYTYICSLRMRKVSIPHNFLYTLGSERIRLVPSTHRPIYTYVNMCI